MVKKLVRELVRRRVPQILGIYLGAAWVAVEFVVMLVDRYRLSSYLVDLSIVLFASLLPTVVLLAYRHGAPGRDGWTRVEKYFVPANLFVTAAVLALLFAGKDLSRRAGGRASGGAAAVADASEPNRTAIVPFRVAGAGPDLGYLHEGMVDLLAAKLTGEAGPLRAIDPRTMVGAWRDALDDDGEDLPRSAAVELARDLGAGRLIVGGAVGTPENLVLQASIVDVPTGQVRGSASVEGSEASLPGLVDRLVAELLSRAAGEDEHRLAQLTSTSLPALRAFLAGRAAHRGGDYEEALQRYGRALDLDSTFALAGLGVIQVSGWVGGSRPAARRGSAVARRYQDRLSAWDRVGLTGRIAPRDPDRLPSVAEELDAAEQALRRWPDHPVLWYRRGDLLMHWGTTLGVASWAQKSRESLQRAIELDPNYAEPVHHLAVILRVVGDTTALRSLTTRQLARTPDGPIADYLRWQTHHVLDRGSPNDVPTLESMDTDATLRWIGIVTQDYGFAISDGARAVRLRLGRPGIRDAQLERRLGVFAYELNEGRPAEALAMLLSLPEVYPDARFHHLHRRLALLTAIYADGDEGAAEEAAVELAAAETGGAVGELNACVRAQWHLYAAEHGLVTGPEVDPARLPSTTVVSGPWAAARAICAAVVEAQLAAGGDSASWRASVERLEGLLAMGRHRDLVDDGHTEYAHLALARLQVTAGDSAAALAALRRRAYYIGWQPYLAAVLRMEGRLAAALGDTAGAIDAYEHYLAFRRYPEPSLREELREVRAELAAIR